MAWHDVCMLTSFAGSPGTASLGYLGIHGISDNPDNGRGMRDTFIANNDCTGEENPPPSEGSLTHVKTEYTCATNPVTWITFVSTLVTTWYDQRRLFLIIIALFSRTVATHPPHTTEALETTDRRLSFPQRPGSSSASFNCRVVRVIEQKGLILE